MTQKRRKRLEVEGDVSALRVCKRLVVGFRSVVILLLSVAIMTALATATAEAAQVADNTYNPPIQNPAYPQNSGPVVAIDEAHFNHHTMEGRYKPFATLLQRDGYVVRPSTSQFSAQSLQGVDILVISNPLSQTTALQAPNYSSPTPSAFTDAEIQAVRTWVENGGSLWLIADHYPWPGATENLAASFGIRMLNGYAMREGSDSNFYFRRSGGTEVLTDNVISNGRSAAERVNNQVMNFTGSAFQVDANRDAQPLLVLGSGVTSIMPTKAWTWDRNTPRINVGGWYQGAAFRYGQGRVAVFGEAAMFTAQLKDGTPFGMNAQGAEENYKFVLNVSHWLSGLLDQNTGTTIDTSITSGPSGFTASPSASFGFSSTREGSTFECSLDDAVFGPCTSPKDYAGLAGGSHTFRVRAIDDAGNADATPAARTWTVDITKPTITITTPADGGTYSLDQVVNANYSCQDTAGGSGLKSCQGTVANGSAVDAASTGTKTFTVIATDNAGNQHSVTHTYSVVAGVPSDCTIVGTSGDDTLNGTPQADVICALEGNDTINSSGANDVLRGGPGDDTLVDLSGTDNLLGGVGADRLNSRDGVRSDQVNGGDGVDSCTADNKDRITACP